MIFGVSGCQHSQQPETKGFPVPGYSSGEDSKENQQRENSSEPAGNAEPGVHIEAGETAGAETMPGLDKKAEPAIMPDSEIEVGPEIITELEIEPEQPIIYRNEKLGFELSFPESWDGWYLINAIGENAIEVAFFGRSILSATDFFNEGGAPGLHIFLVANEAFITEGAFLDSIKEIGIAGAERFYFATTTDYPLGALKDNGEAYFRKLDEAETALVKADFEKAMKMRDDVDSILQTFRAI
jgi:hypothetical protein